MLQLVSRDIRNVFSHNYRKLNDRQSRYINRQVVKARLALTRQIFKVCNMPKLSLATCCKVLQEIATIQKYNTMSPLNQRHKSKRLKWVRKYKKMHFSNVIFISKWHATLAEWDKWAKLLDLLPPLSSSSSTSSARWSKGHVLASQWWW